MSYDVKSDKMDWKNEYSWMVISIISGILLSFLFFHFDRFPGANTIIVMISSCFGFYILSLLLRIQNQRGRVLTGKPASKERIIKYIFPVIGFVFGFALIFGF
jgi:uncharacterized membrane protein